jgi:hypothetical protein
MEIAKRLILFLNVCMGLEPEQIVLHHLWWTTRKH